MELLKVKTNIFRNAAVISYLLIILMGQIIGYP